MSQLQSIRKTLDDLKLQKCSRKDCLSNNRGSLQLVWFGKQYQNKQITCSSCYMLNDQQIKKSLPACYNVLPLLKFSDKLLEEYRAYEDKKKATTWHPLVMKEKKTQLINQMGLFQARLNLSLSSLQKALQNFTKKLSIRNKQIFTHQIMSEIIQLKNKNTFQTLLNKINELVKQLNYSEITKNYEFQRIEMRNKKIQKEKQKITEVIQKVEKVLIGLLEQVKRINQLIQKI